MHIPKLTCLKARITINESKTQVHSRGGRMDLNTRGLNTRLSLTGELRTQTRRRLNWWIVQVRLLLEQGAQRLRHPAHQWLGVTEVPEQWAQQRKPIAQHPIVRSLEYQKKDQMEASELCQTQRKNHHLPQQDAQQKKQPDHRVSHAMMLMEQPLRRL